MAKLTDNNFIAFISDMHLAPVEAGRERQQSNRDLPERRARQLEEVLGQIESGPRPAAVLFGGDNANQPVSREVYRQESHAFMKRFPDPVYAIPGNHDIGSTKGWHHHSPHELAEACKAFRKDFPDWWSFESCGFHIVAVNSQIFGSGLPDEAEQSRWLKSMLEKRSDGLKLVFAHTPLYIKSPDDNFSDGTEQMYLQAPARKPFLEILRAAAPDILVTSHAHRFWISKQEDWDWIGLPSTALGLDEMRSVPSDNLPPGDDSLGWVSLRRDGSSWKADLHKISIV